MIAERSDWNVLLDNRRFTLTERVPEPLDMTDTEILDWMDEYCASARWVIDKWKVSSFDCDGVSMSNLRESVCLAAAYHKEANE